MTKTHSSKTHSRTLSDLASPCRKKKIKSKPSLIKTSNKFKGWETKKLNCFSLFSFRWHQQRFLSFEMLLLKNCSSPPFHFLSFNFSCFLDFFFFTCRTWKSSIDAFHGKRQMMFSALGQAVLIIRQCFGFFSVAVSPVCALGGCCLFQCYSRHWQQNRKLLALLGMFALILKAMTQSSMAALTGSDLYWA